MVGRDLLDRPGGERVPKHVAVLGGPYRRTANELCDLEAPVGVVHGVVQYQVLRACLRRDRLAPLSRVRHMPRRPGGSHVRDAQRRPRQIGQHDRAVRRLGFDGGRTAGGVVRRSGLPGRQVALDEVVDRAVVLAVDQDEAAVRAGHLQHTQQATIVDDLVAVGHVELEGREAILNQRRDFGQHVIAHIGDDVVESVVDDGVGLDLGEASVACVEQRFAAALQREVDDRRNPTAGTRHRAREEVVRRGDAEPVDGVPDVRVRVDAARHDPMAACVYDLGREIGSPRAGDTGPDRSDASVADEHVAGLHAGGGDDRPARDEEVATPAAGQCGCRAAVAPSRPGTSPWPPRWTPPAG